MNGITLGDGLKPLPDLTILPMANAPSQTKAPVEPPTFSMIEEV